MATVHDVAKYILERMAPNNDTRITTWKLQKLVYYSQAWSLVWDDQPLFEEEIQAWSNGPVCPDLYYAHRGRFKIYVDQLTNGESSNLSKDEVETIEAVLSHYGDFSPQYLSELTHSELPWIKAREGLEPGERGSNLIRLDVMAEYYGGL